MRNYFGPMHGIYRLGKAAYLHTPSNRQLTRFAQNQQLTPLRLTKYPGKSISTEKVEGEGISSGLPSAKSSCRKMIRVNGKLVWDEIGSWEYSQDILNFSGSPEDKRMQSRFYVFLAVGKLLFGRKGDAQAMDFACGMTGVYKTTFKEVI